MPPTLRHAPITSTQFKQARDKLVARVDVIDPHSDGELMLSGGVDSATVLFAMLEAGRRPRCLTFYLEGVESRDLRVSRSMCQEFGLEHVAVMVPRLPATIREDSRKIIELVDWSRLSSLKKTVVQCVHPFLYLYPAMVGPRPIFGLGGDNFHLPERTWRVLLHEKGDEAIRLVRRSWSADPNYSDWHIQDLGRRVYGKTPVDLYDFTWLGAWFQQFDDVHLNKPCQKWSAVGMFNDYWNRGRWFREQSSFQVNSGLREAHDTIMEPQDKSVVSVYNRMAHQSGAVKLLGTCLPTRDVDGNIIDATGVILGAPTELDYQEVAACL